MRLRFSAEGTFFPGLAFRMSGPHQKPRAAHCPSPSPTPWRGRHCMVVRVIVGLKRWRNGEVVWPPSAGNIVTPSSCLNDGEGTRLPQDGHFSVAVAFLLCNTGNETNTISSATESTATACYSPGCPAVAWQSAAAASAAPMPLVLILAQKRFRRTTMTTMTMMMTTRRCHYRLPLPLPRTLHEEKY